MNIQGNLGDQVVSQALKLQPGQVLHDIEHPGDGRETYVSKKGAIEHLSHKKIMGGDLAEFKSKQEILAKSVLDAVDGLRNATPFHGGDAKLTRKIMESAEKQLKEAGKNDAAGRNELAKEMLVYANRLLEASMHRRGELKSERGILDEEVLKHIGASGPQFHDLVHSLYPRLSNAERLGADILRYGEQGKITVRDVSGREINLGDQDNAYEYVNNMLEKLMINLGMVTEGDEPELNDRAQAILAKLELGLKGPDSASSSSSRPQIGADRLSDAIGSLIHELKESDDPKERKLAFALFAMSQNWIVQPAKEFGSLAREVLGHERFSGMATVDLKDMTHFDIKFGQDGGITLEAKGVYVNKDYEGRGEEFTAHFTTTVKMPPTGDDRLAISYHVLLEHPPGKGQDPAITKLKSVLREQGIAVDTRGVDRNSQRMATAANGLMGAIREKDLREVGVFRVGGTKSVYEGFVNDTLPKIHPGDSTRLSDELEEMNLTDLTSSLKFLIREKYHLVSGNDLTSAFLSAGAEDDPAVIRELVNNLPREKREVLMDLIQLCHTILVHTDENQMTPKSLAISISPSVFPEADPMQFEAQQKAFIKLLEAFPRQ